MAINKNGLVVWRGASEIDGAPIVMIVTGLTSKSQNVKTGAMMQTWILREDVDPVEAMRRNFDVSICGDCPLRGMQVDGKRVGRACYVNVGQAPRSVWECFNRGNYREATPQEAAELIDGRPIRLGSYGDPSLVPFDVLDALASGSKMRTGYTHQWRSKDPRYASLLMASADTVEDRRDARLAGWRSFYVIPKGAAKPAGAVECASTRDLNKRDCETCGMCSGVKGGKVATDVFIAAHGAGAKFV